MTPSPVSEAMLHECASEPIHLLGRTQRFGVLLAFDRTQRIVAASGNTGDWCGQPPRALLGSHAETVLPARSVDAAFAHARLAAAAGAVRHLHHVAWPGRAEAVDVTVHAVGSLVVVEAEPSGTEPAGAAVAMQTCASELAAMRDTFELASSAASAVARVTGYDRVMVYRFSADGSGTVIAERCAPGQPAYLGLRYPAGDIPPQARALYLRNPIRVIADAGDPGVPVHTLGHAPLDLSLAVLRSVSPIHLEYLRNMGTAASMSISLIVDGRLWGLIACHHRTPFRPALACRAMSELLGRLYSLALSQAERQPLENEIKKLLLVPPGVDPLFDVESHPLAHQAACATIGRVMGLSGVVTHIDGRHGNWGLTPSEDQVDELLAALSAAEPEPVTALESLERLRPEFGHLAPRVSGMLALPLGVHGRDWVLLLRDEVLQHVRWAGNPDKAIARRPDGRLTPRGSFAAWRASVRGHCEPWTLAEVELAKVLRTRLLELHGGRQEQRAIESTRQAAHQQALLVRELNHRVRNMLGLIKGLVQQTSLSAVSIEDLTKRLHDRVHSLSRAYSQIEKANWQPTPLAALLQDEVGAFGEPGQVSLEGSAVLVESQAYLSFAMVIHELATNARKHGALSTPQGRITVRWQISDGGALEIDWQESGGPPVARPKRHGFGTRVIRQGLQHQLRGHATLDFEPAGLRARLWTMRGFVPAGVPRASSSALPADPSRAADGVAGKVGELGVVLVVEDDLVIALLAEAMLQQMGCRLVLTAGTVEDALQLLAKQSVDMALLDINLGPQSSERVALRLAELGVPTVVTTGYSETDSVPEPLRLLRRVCKPYTLAELERAMADVVAAPA
jgi:light-regulated signal transduction histidine kinase (bacteriophytochrome)